MPFLIVFLAGTANIAANSGIGGELSVPRKTWRHLRETGYLPSLVPINRKLAGTHFSYALRDVSALLLKTCHKKQEIELGKLADTKLPPRHLYRLTYRSSVLVPYSGKAVT